MTEYENGYDQGWADANEARDKEENEWDDGYQHGIKQGLKDRQAEVGAILNACVEKIQFENGDDTNALAALYAFRIALNLDWRLRNQ